MSEQMTEGIPKQASVVIVGGGVMGASTAYHLALQGYKDVVLLEREPFFGMGATGKCAGGIRYQFSTEINILLSKISLPMLERFEDETGQAIDLRKCGYLFLLSNEDDVEHFRENVQLQRSLGIMTEWLSGDDVRNKVPLLVADDVLAGTFHAEDGLVDPNGVVSGYVSAGRRLGALFFTDVEVMGIGIRENRIQSVRTTEGTIECEILVNAAGPWSANVSAMANLPLPVLPIRRQMLTTTPLPDIPTNFPFVIDFAQSLYFHREGEGLLTGMSNPYQEPGFDESVDEGWELIHMEAAIARLAILASASRVSAWAGLYEVTPDAHPIIGTVPDIEGYYLVTGFSGHGFMHGPVAGLLIAEMIIHGQPTTLDISSLNYGRFDRGDSADEYNII
jgi:sarcosine oxidase subunit beta